MFQYDTHTFVIRTAPERSAYAGQVCAELRCDGQFQAGLPLKQLNIRSVQVLETWVHPVKGWKLLRFTASTADYIKLAQSCKEPNVKHIADESASHVSGHVISIVDLLAQLPDKVAA